MTKREYKGIFYVLKSNEIININNRDNIEIITLNIGFIGDTLLVNKLKENDKKHEKCIFTKYYYNNNEYEPDTIFFKFNFYYFTNNNINKYNIDIFYYCINLCDCDKDFIDSELAIFNRHNVYLNVEINPEKIDYKKYMLIAKYKSLKYSTIINSNKLFNYISLFYIKIDRILSKKKTPFLLGTHKNSESFINMLPDDIIWKIINFI